MCYVKHAISWNGKHQQKYKRRQYPLHWKVFISCQEIIHIYNGRHFNIQISMLDELSNLIALKVFVLKYWEGLED